MNTPRPEPALNPELPALITAIGERLCAVARPLLVAIDGRSGAGKSTLAQRLAERLTQSSLRAAVIAGDDFFAGGVVVRTDSPAARATSCIDFSRQRPVLKALRHSQPATWHAFDWEAFDGSLRSAPSLCMPERVILLEGVYSARPELADLLDLRVLLRVPDVVRYECLLAREGSLGAWELQWHEAEDHYFARVVPPPWFDLILDA